MKTLIHIGGTMTDAERLERIGSFGYGVYSIKPVSRKSFRHVGNFAVADPLDDDQGFYLVVNSIEEAYNEMDDAALLDVERDNSKEIQGLEWWGISIAARSRRSS